MRRSNYKLIKSTDKEVVIVDMGPWDVYLSVTNDAENIVDDFAGKLNGRKLLYYDSDGELSELVYVIKSGKEVFSGFAFIERE